MQTSKPLVETPSLKRRLICLVYDAFLIAAVVVLGITLFTIPAVLLKLDQGFIYYGRQVALFFVAALYFIHTWTGSGYTLAMKTWRIKLVKVGYAKVPFCAAAIRYVLAWGWVLPGFAVSYFAHLPRSQYAIAIGINVVVWSLSAFLDKDRQFLHDKLAGTRLILLPKMVKAPVIKSATTPR
jgi:uncharacterized RDD family membrane protein YckC